jgi:putative protease
MLGEKLSAPSAVFALTDGWNLYHFAAMNKFDAGVPLEVITPKTAVIPLAPDNYRLINPETGETRDWVSHGHPCLLATPLDFSDGALLRRKDAALD